MFIGYLMPGFMFPTILDRMKWNDYLPSPLKQWRRREGAKTRQFGITEMAGGVVQISFILSKIVGNRWKSGLLSHKLSRRWGWFMSCTKTRCITNRIKFCCLLKGYSWKTGRSWSTWRSWTDRKSNIWRYWSHWESVNSISCQYRAGHMVPRWPCWRCSQTIKFLSFGRWLLFFILYRPTCLRTTTSPSSKPGGAVRAQNCGSSIELKENINVKITAHSHNALFSVQISWIFHILLTLE